MLRKTKKNIIIIEFLNQKNGLFLKLVILLFTQTLPNRERENCVLLEGGGGGGVKSVANAARPA